MENLKSRKIILILAIILAIVTGLTVSVKAADDTPQQINPAEVVGKNNTSAQNSNANSNSKSNSNSNKNVVNNTNKNANNNASKNTSSYNNTNTSNLPKTGLKNYVPLFATIGCFIVIAFIAYKKANDYKDI